ncbi:Glucan endo-1,3-beta-glucosidase-like protein 1-like [Melia azedarach]|uniref:Glucan endo-1,3-beta-glucosidase-like protein 1-like n=1 Tax=Melia azedarach TaxID=155640 RepID=A0ACC1Z1C2_MELAZ|nr:Glucan endo-1,3-beta-glucosidase-like protein 1-like [Melia azedarach]
MSLPIFPLFLLLSLICHPFLLVVGAQNGGVVVARQLWCVAKNNAEDAALQGALDWACGPGGADCSPIQQGGPCYDPNDVQMMASYAFNDYYLKHGLTDDSCSFSNNAAVTSLNPSHGSCKFPSSSSVKNGNISDSTTVETGTDSADLSGCSQLAHTWFWPLITIHFLFGITHTILK